MAGLKEREARIRSIESTRRYGRLTEISVDSVKVSGMGSDISLGQICLVDDRLHARVTSVSSTSCEIVPLCEIDQLRCGQAVRAITLHDLDGGRDWRGRVIDPLGRPLDGRGKPPLLPAFRHGTGGRVQFRQIDTGLAAIDTLAPVIEGVAHAVYWPDTADRSHFTARLSQRIDADVTILVGFDGDGGEDFDAPADDRQPSRMVRMRTGGDPSPAMRTLLLDSALRLARLYSRAGARVALFIDRRAIGPREIRSIDLRAPLRDAERVLVPPSGQPQIRTGPITSFVLASIYRNDWKDVDEDPYQSFDNVIAFEETLRTGVDPVCDIARSRSRLAPRVFGSDRYELSRRLRHGLAGPALEMTSDVKNRLRKSLEEVSHNIPSLEEFCLRNDFETSTQAFDVLAALLGSEGR
ncbi:hypothetical protein [Roseobacter sp. HKCCA0434]|uniref:hypothetical protein n=1 Tax=Roseobacter sp. HKCCA0434 TaxID=3079297 RepID=UPI002905EB9A|nr:hypothetical protein [Roseobacter sp. HKCCA0434]